MVRAPRLNVDDAHFIIAKVGGVYIAGEDGWSQNVDIANLEG
jgi:hypothetical protein